MPDVKIYIRVEDVDTWNAIGNKSEFVHNALKVADDYKALPAEDRTAVKKHIASMPRAVPDVPGVVKGSDFVPKPPDPEKGWPCCQKRSPCKHWHWDDIKEVWENELTGKTRSE